MKHQKLELKCYKCTNCQMSFTKKADFKNHQLIHSGKEKFVCEVCSQIFREQARLKRHKIVHAFKKELSLAKNKDMNYEPICKLEGTMLVGKLQTEMIKSAKKQSPNTCYEKFPITESQPLTPPNKNVESEDSERDQEVVNTIRKHLFDSLSQANNKAKD